MNTHEKNGTKSLIVMLVLIVGFVVYVMIFQPLLEKNEVEKPKEEKPEEVNLEELGEELYAKFTLDINEELAITDSDKAALNNKLTIYKMSDQLKINLGIKNVGEEYITNDGGYSLKESLNNMNGGFYYSGKFITRTAIDQSMERLFGAVPVEHQTITLIEQRYVYNEKKDIYEIWVLKNDYEGTEKKVTNYEITAKDDQILVIEYVAYTDYKDLDNIKTRTVTRDSVEVVITEENVRDYLSYMDKYRYTFEKREDGNYYFVSVEYMYD